MLAEHFVLSEQYPVCVAVVNIPIDILAREVQYLYDRTYVIGESSAYWRQWNHFSGE